MRYIKWSSPETELEKFQYFGIFIKETEFYIHMNTNFGEMCIQKTNGTFSESTQEEYDSVIIEQPKLPKNETTKESGSKAERARAIYARLHKAGKARKDIIKEFIDVVGLTKAGAATYYQTISKKQKKA